MKKIILVVILVAVFSAAASFALAGYYDTSLVPCGAAEKGTTMCTLCHLVLMATKIFKYLLAISLAAAILFIVVGGIMYIVSSGSENLMNTAKTAIKYSLIGFAMCLFAWVLVNSVAKALGYKEQWWSLSDFKCVAPAVNTNTEWKIDWGE